MKKLLSIIVACLFIISSGTNMAITAHAEGFGPDIPRSELKFSEIENKHYDTEKLYNALKEIEEISKQEGQEKHVVELYKIIFEEIDNLITAQTINQIYYNKDVTNDEYATENEYYSRVTIEAMDNVYVSLNKALDSKYKDALTEVMGTDLARMISSYDEMTDDDYELSNKEQELIQEYELASVKDYSVTIDGKEWTEDMLYDEDLELTEDEQYDIYVAIQKEKNKVMGNIFVELVKLRNQISENSGYSSYADYSYEMDYGRDYSTEEIAKVHKAVKKYLVPLYQKLSDNISCVDLETLNLIHGHSDKDVLNRIGKHMIDIAPELEYSFKYMLDHELYDISNEPTKLDTGYTCYLYRYSVPFIYNSPYDTYNDYKDMVHEFGHFNNAFYEESHILSTEFSSLDVNEIQSQALELLFLEYSEDIYGKATAEAANYVSVLDHLRAVIQGCCFNEFQIALYNNPDMTLQEINQLYKEISESYGSYYPEGTTEDYGWVVVGHTFQSPMYYISYATSGLSSLDIWANSLSDRPAAIEQYMKVAIESYGMEYKEVLDECELRNIFHAKNISEISNDIADYMGVEGTPYQGINYAPILIAVFATMIIILIVVIIISKRDKKKMKQIEMEKKELLLK